MLHCISANCRKTNTTLCPVFSGSELVWFTSPIPHPVITLYQVRLSLNLAAMLLSHPTQPLLAFWFLTCLLPVSPSAFPVSVGGRLLGELRRPEHLGGSPATSVSQCCPNPSSSFHLRCCHLNPSTQLSMVRQHGNPIFQSWEQRDLQKR